MADETNTEGTPDAPKMYDEAYVKNLRAEAAGLRVKLREAETARDAVTNELEANKTELAKAQEAANKTAAAEMAALRLEVAFDSGLPKTFAKRLVGETKEELEADAKSLAETLPKNEHPNLHQGNVGGSVNEGPNPNDAIRALVFGN